MTSFEKVSGSSILSKEISDYRAERDKQQSDSLTAMQQEIENINFEASKKRKASIGMMSFGTNAVKDFEFDNVLPAAADGKKNLFHRDQFKNGLWLIISLWEPSGGDDGTVDYLLIYVNGVPVINGKENGYDYTYKFTLPVAEADLPGRFVIPFDSLRLGNDGLKSIHYTVTSGETGNRETSNAQFMTLDLLDPALNDNPDAIEFAADMADGVVTLKYLEEHDGKVVLHVLPYFDYYPDDKYFIYVAGNPVPIRQGDVPEEAEFDGFDFELDEETIRNLVGEGVSVLQYKLVDRAGNATDFSVPVHFTIRLTPEPTGLLPPQVPAAPVNRDDARNGVAAIVPNNESIPVGALVRVFWGDTSRVREVIWPANAVTFDFDTIARPDDQVRDPALRVWYEVVVGKNNYPSEDTLVAVDLSTVGPNPGGPGPINPSLKVVGAQGNTTQQPGFIRPADIGAGAVLLWPVYEGAAAGHFVTLFYGKKENKITFTLQGTELPGTTISIPIPWEYVEAGGNGQIPIGYEFQESETTGNPQQAPDGMVDVSIATVTVSAKVTFPDRIGGITDVPGTKPITNLGVLNCEGKRPLPDGVTLAITEKRGVLAKDDLVFITLSVCSDKAGEVIVAGRQREIPVVVSEQEAIDGKITRVVPLFKSYFEVVDQPGKYYELGSFLASWRIVKAGNIPGASLPSAVRFAFRRPGGGLCLPAEN